MNTNETTLDSQHVPSMRRCIELAKIASRRGNTPVGSVVVINGEIVGEGIEELPRRNSVTGQKRLDKMDARSSCGSWTVTTLELIAANPGTRAAELAASAGLETQRFKTNVRKLKELGLTESLEVGYRLSSRGKIAIKRL